MQLSLWLALLAACLLISFTPGAGAINTMSNSLSSGFRRSLWGILGQQIALLIQIAIVAAGVGLLVSSSPIAFHVIRYAGAAYLVYLGIRKLLAKPADAAEEKDKASQESAFSMLRRGFWVNLLNPKAIVFFLAFVPQFIRPDQPLLPQYLVLAATVVLVDVVVMWLFFAAAARSLRRFTESQRGEKTLNRTFGGLFVGAGVLLAVV
ncbi:homoserine/homoserine lactone efflux protein [Psychromicrobium silvestre]|uniref:Homoserine/homoserine lactone efflux protein n=1 Tax=Psychromicrobium silvestre TaxID=1645614 RepID=A0A7Y9LU67_9MICC|nr:LysE family transporter [Psychromicrobium silvestre]NYE95666.1 homoserine/homoserine lactone efflux protein [Psychromicrobium silvestre]